MKQLMIMMMMMVMAIFLGMMIMMMMMMMMMTIAQVKPGDYGAYKCVSKNSLGETEGQIRLYGKLNVM